MSADELAASFGRVAAEYELARPGWPEEALDVLGLARSAAVLDLAAGTGKLTRVLVRRFDRVIAVEPLAEMRELLERLVPKAEAVAGSATAIPVADGSLDAVFVAEAFHWFATTGAVTEIARVLRPGGVLALLWNRSEDDFDPPPPEAFWKLFHEHTVEKPPEQSSRSGLWRTVFPGPFEPLREAAFPNELVVDRDGMVAHICSWSIVAALPEAERHRLRAGLTAIAPPGRYRLGLRTELFWTRLAA